MSESWILEVRRLLAASSPANDPLAAGNGGGAAGNEGQRSVSDGPRGVALVPLYVDAGELWTLLTTRAAPAGRVAPMAFPGAVVDAGEELWPAALRGVRDEAGIASEVVLDLGRLASVTTPAGLTIVPCVGAVPTPAVDKRSPPQAGAAVVEVAPLPLSALAAPQLVEAQPVEIDGTAAELAVYHVGRHRIWGVTARICGDLLARLGLGGPMAGG